MEIGLYGEPLGAMGSFWTFMTYGLYGFIAGFEDLKSRAVAARNTGRLANISDPG